MVVGAKTCGPQSRGTKHRNRHCGGWSGSDHRPAGGEDGVLRCHVGTLACETRGHPSAEEVLKRYGLPDRGIAFRRIVNHCNLTRKPDQVLVAIHYLRSIEGAPDSPPRVVMSLFTDAGIEPPGNLSLYLNRLRERGFLDIPEGSPDKNRFVIVTDAGRHHLDMRSQV